MYTRQLACPTLALLALAGLAVSSQAAVTEYTDFTAFSAAVPSLTTLDFAAANTSGGTTTNYSTPRGLTLNGVNFVGQYPNGTYGLGVAAPAFYPVYSGFTGDPTILQPSNGNIPLHSEVTVTLPSGTTAVGTNLYTIQLGDFSANTVVPVTVGLSTGASYTVDTFEKPTLAFVGFVSDTPISSLTFQSNPSATSNLTFPNLSSFSFGPGQNPAVPEPGPFALLALGLPLVGLLARKKMARRA